MGKKLSIVTWLLKDDLKCLSYFKLLALISTEIIEEHVLVLMANAVDVFNDKS